MIINRTLKNPRSKFVVSESVLHEGLSLEALALLGYLLSLSEDDSPTIENIAHYFSCGKGAVRRAVGELEKKGHLVRTFVSRNHGRNEWSWTVYETPLPVD